ncbi:hypothetical protein OZ664_14895 [Elizabethkingia sp. HX WHF]|uniref:Uncharacterized protein n=1 Tax=Elizabethkingia bruuniana TaxID=1756149 RepID=A0A7T7UWZ4_9FLAO|nr:MULTISPECIES: hypothetical protein [Elizabethkingia]ATL43251.1 hypothetical protein CQS02_08000 [Elizabethkingia miricola]AQX84317.1 hypothetical protein AYC65_04460 [Elizabethkingia bruuniana]KUY27771.1 hypothetical protein ATB97_16460 [Elizabethkingia bruuniana]MCL1638686.1 hypothetical protein [Elizabethkingia bruuniana]MDX8565293.1 hypothetical protein [Elizabethkingia sp. HX WHF]
MKNNKQDEEKNVYVPPKIEVAFVEMEQGIASGSAKIVPTNIYSEIKEEWEKGDAIEGELDW